MKLQGVLLYGIPALVVLLVAVHGVSGWNVQDVVIRPAGPISPGTPVTVSGTVHFDSWMTGLTFPADSTLDLYTELADATWDVSLTDYEQDPPETSPLLTKKSVQARVDGWTLSYSSRQLDLNVRVTGTAPDVDRTQEKIMIRVQERDSGGKALTPTAVTRRSTIVVATPAPTAPPPTMAPVTAATPEETPPVPVTPTKKQTWAPGPDPLLTCGMLGIAVILIAAQRNR